MYYSKCVWSSLYVSSLSLSLSGKKVDRKLEMKERVWQVMIMYVRSGFFLSRDFTVFIPWFMLVIFITFLNCTVLSWNGYIFIFFVFIFICLISYKLYTFLVFYLNWWWKLMIIFFSFRVDVWMLFIRIS